MTPPKGKPKKKKIDAAALLDANPIVGKKTGVSYQFTDNEKAVIEEANRRRLAGARSSCLALARLLKDTFDTPLSETQLRRRIREYVGRASW